MTKLYYDNDIMRRSIGFGDFYAALTNQAANYPHYDIVEVSEDTTEILVAVAGFSKDELKVTFDESKRVLTLTGTKKESDTQKRIYSGIARRSFKIWWPVSSSFAVKGTALKDGILTITLERTEPIKKIVNITID